MQRIYLCATVYIYVTVSIVAADGVRRAVPRVTFACVFDNGCVQRVVDGEVQGHHGITAHRIGERVR